MLPHSAFEITSKSRRGVRLCRLEHHAIVENMIEYRQTGKGFDSRTEIAPLEVNIAVSVAFQSIILRKMDRPLSDGSANASHLRLDDREAARETSVAA